MPGYPPNGDSFTAALPCTLTDMRIRSLSRTLVNPRPESLRLRLSDGSERVVPPWGVAVVPRTIGVLSASLLERRTIPGRIEEPTELLE
jgi:hypothetical protein